MPFALLDDKFHSNAKILAAGNAGAGLYARALSYCADHLTDGFVPMAFAMAAATKAQRDKLEQVGLWRQVRVGESHQISDRKRNLHTIVMPGVGYYINDYLYDNPSRANVADKRKKKAEAGAKGAEKRWQTDSTDIAPATGVLSPSYDQGNAPRFPDSQLDQEPSFLPTSQVHEEQEGRTPNGTRPRQKTEADIVAEQELGLAPKKQREPAIAHIPAATDDIPF